MLCTRQQAMNSDELTSISGVEPATPQLRAFSPPGCVARRSARVTYWTGWLSPEMEGCSKEVFALKEHFFRSRVFGLSRYYRLKVSRRERYLGISVQLNALFRTIAPVYDLTSEINHIYGSLREWFFLRALRRRPIIMTVASDEPPFERQWYRHVRRFVVHAPSTAMRLIELGFDPTTIHLIYPGLSLERFRPLPRAHAPVTAWPTGDAGRFRVLFATTPNWLEGVETRGVNLILQTARERPDVDFFLPWRPWAGAEHLVDLCRKQAPPNVHVSKELVPDMRHLFQAADATVAPFVTAESTKICPTSLVESLACGRPVLVSTKVGLSDLVHAEACGKIFEPSVDGLCRALDALRQDYCRCASNARAAAERHFDLQVCLQQHEQLYDEVLRSPC